MKYQSTRGSPKRLSFEEVLVNAYAEDGGLYLPENIPQVSSEDLKAWSSLSYVELCKAIVCLYVDEVEYKSLNLNGMDTTVEKTLSIRPLVTVVNSSWRIRGCINKVLSTR